MMRSRKFFMSHWTANDVLDTMDSGYNPFAGYNYLPDDLLKDPYSISAINAMQDRYHIHLLFLAGLVRQEQKADVRKIDNKIIDDSHYFTTKTIAVSSSEIVEFIDWLRNAIIEEEKL